MGVDLDRVRAEASATKPPRHPPRARVPGRGRKFVKGPIPLRWLSVAAALPGRAFHVAIAIWHAAGLQKSGAVRLSYATLAAFAVDRFAYYRALAALENARLITVADQGTGKAPIVTLLDVPESEEAP